MYIKRKKGFQKVEYDFNELEKYTNETFGVMLYQEQLMFAAQVLAGYSLGQADDGIRKPIAKKKQSLVQENRGYFIYGKTECPNCHGKKGNKKCDICNQTGYITLKQAKELDIDYEVIIPGGIVNGFDEDKLNALYDDMDKFGSYCFNKSHSATYAVLTYQTAFMKTYFPAEFMASVISFAKDSEERGFYIEHARKIGLEIMLPDINSSNGMCTVENGKIRLGLELIQGVSNGASYIIEARQNGPFEDFDDFYNRINRTKVDKKKVTALIKVGCFKSISELNYHELYNYYMKIKEEKEPEFLPVEITKKQLAEYEFTLLGARVEQINRFEQKKDGEQITVTGNIKTLKVFKDKNGRDMCFLSIEGKDLSVECIVFASTFKNANDIIFIDSKVQIKGKKDKGKLITDNIKAS